MPEGGIFEGAGTGIDVVDNDVTVVVRPEDTRVIVLVIVEGTVVRAGLLDAEEGVGNERVKPSLCVELVEPDGNNAGLPVDVDGRDGGMMIVVEVEVNVVVWPPGNVLVKVVVTLDVTGSTGMMGAPGEDEVITVAEVRIIVVVGPSGTVLVSVVKTLDVTGGAGVGVSPGTVGLSVVTEVVVKVVVDPPETVLVKVVTVLEVVGSTNGGELPGGVPPRTVVEVLVIVVVGPPGMVLVRITRALDVVGRAGPLGL